TAVFVVGEFTDGAAPLRSDEPLGFEGVFDGRSARSGPASIPVSAEIGSSRPPHGAVLGGHTGVRIVMPFADRTGLLTLFGQRAVGLETSTVRDLGPPPGRG